MKTYGLIFSALALATLAACSSAPKVTGPSYDSDFHYDYEKNRPEYVFHAHHAVVKDIRRIQLDSSIPTGTILSSTIDTPVGSGQLINRDVVDVVLPGGAILTIVQDNNSKFGRGQHVKILGTGLTGRILVDAHQQPDAE